MSSPELSFYVKLEPVDLHWLQLLSQLAAPGVMKVTERGGAPCALAWPGHHGTCNPVSNPDPGKLVRLKRRAQV